MSSVGSSATTISQPCHADSNPSTLVSTENVGRRTPLQHQRRQQLSSTPAAACAQQPQRQQLQAQRQFSRVIPHAEPESQNDGTVEYNKEFGYSRKDVLIIIVGLIALGVVMYEGLQAMGMDAGIAGNWVQATIFLGICVGWVSTYLWRVANKVRRQQQ
jgi:hypothetical protein